MAGAKSTLLLEDMKEKGIIKIMPKVFTSQNQKIGEIGESVACKYLLNKGFKIIERNYTKKWGEIDIVSEKEGKLYFIEVKAVSRVTLDNVSSETITDEYRPEDNMHPWKLKRLGRAIQTYLLERKIWQDAEWQLDLAVVYLDMTNRKGKVKILSDIVI